MYVHMYIHVCISAHGDVGFKNSGWCVSAWHVCKGMCVCVLIVCIHRLYTCMYVCTGYMHVFVQAIYTLYMYLCTGCIHVCVYVCIHRCVYTQAVYMYVCTGYMHVCVCADEAISSHSGRSMQVNIIHTMQFITISNVHPSSAKRIIVTPSRLALNEYICWQSSSIA